MQKNKRVNNFKWLLRVSYWSACPSKTSRDKLSNTRHLALAYRPGRNPRCFLLFSNYTPPAISCDFAFTAIKGSLKDLKIPSATVPSISWLSALHPDLFKQFSRALYRLRMHFMLSRNLFYICSPTAQINLLSSFQFFQFLRHLVHGVTRHLPIYIYVALDLQNTSNIFISKYYLL
jgi:hypothetical protein